MITNLRSTIWGRLKDLANAKVVQLCAAGVPNSNTGKHIAGKGSLYTDITAGDIYINKGTITAPSWSKANALAALAQTDSRNVAATGVTDFFVFAPNDGKLNYAFLVSASPVPANSTNYIVVTVTNLGQDGTGNVPMLAATDFNTTKATAIVAGTPKTLEVNGTPENLEVKKYDRIRIRTAVTGTLSSPINGVQFALEIG